MRFHRFAAHSLSLRMNDAWPTGVICHLHNLTSGDVFLILAAAYPWAGRSSKLSTSDVRRCSGMQLCCNPDRLLV